MLSGHWSDGTGLQKEGFMSLLQMAQQLKQIHPDYVLIYKVGVFYNTYGKDSYIIASNFNYAINMKGNIAICGVSKKAIGKVTAKLEEKKINYLIIDPRNNYDVEAKSDNKNLNTYNKEFEKAYLIEKHKRKIHRIVEKLSEYVGKNEFPEIIQRMEEILNENREI